LDSPLSRKLETVDVAAGLSATTESDYRFVFQKEHHSRKDAFSYGLAQASLEFL